MDALTTKHGEVAGWMAGCHERCCAEAMLAYNRKWRSDVAIWGPAGRRRVTAVGTVRRLQALKLMGWTWAEVARECGWKSAQSASNLLERGQVNRTTAEAVAKAYRRLAMRWIRGELNGQTGSGLRAREIAAAKRAGFVPMAAWDDIDDPRDSPQGLGEAATVA